MKRLFLVFCVCLQVFVSASAMAWSPLDVFRSAVDPGSQCYTLIAAGEEDQEQNKSEGKEEEEEPDCD